MRISLRVVVTDVYGVARASLRVTF